MPDGPPPRKDGLPTPQELHALSHVPFLNASFRRARAEMPDSIRAVFETHGLSARHGAVLTQLLAEQPSSVTELASRLGVSLSTASELVGDLSRATLVTRHEDPENRRRTLVSLANDHRADFEVYVARRTAPLLRALDRLSPRDQRGFLTGLTEWAREVREQAE